MEGLLGFTIVQILAALLTALVAAFVRGLAGFGMAIILVPVLALALTPVEAVMITNVVALCIGLSEFARIVRESERSAVVLCALTVVATAPGLIALAATPPDLARLLIALVALSAFIAILLPTRAANVPGPVTTCDRRGDRPLTGFAGMPGPPVVPYYVGRAIPRHVAKASMLLIFTVAAGAGMASGLAIGVMRWRLVVLGLLLFPTVLVGNWLGSLAFGKIGDRVWRSFVALVLAAAAAAALVKLLQG